MDSKGSALGRNQFAGTAAAHGSVLSHVPSGSSGTPNLGNPVAATGAYLSRFCWQASLFSCDIFASSRGCRFGDAHVQQAIDALKHRFC